MCGIVGYLGSKKAQSILLGGLKRLEYRGYDSAGVITLSNSGEATLLRKKGKVGELAAEVSKNYKTDTVGIGHTRWATHGAPSVKNAHPHKAGEIYVVHNGIIENYQDLKTALTKQGYKFASDTDTEVLAQLINSYYDKGDKNLLDAVMAALRSVVGAYGIAVASTREPDVLVVARKGSPLIIGLGDDEVYIASDASALVGHAEQVMYLNDGEVALCKRDGVELFDLQAQPINGTVEKLELDLQTIQKKGYDHFLLKEIMEQPETLRSTLSGRLSVKDSHAKLGGPNLSDDELRAIKHILIVGCGTAYYAGQLASYFIEQITEDVSLEVAVASELRYRSFQVPEGTVALIVSQSGETADTLACMRELKQRGVKCLGIINAVGSTIAREVDGGVYVHVGPEISVASTKAFTSQVAAMLLFGLTVAQAKGVSPQRLNKYIAELDKLPKEIEKVLKTHSTEVKKLAKKYATKQHALYLGRDTLFPVALEGALKLKEISYIQAEGYAAGELKHGPIALIDDRFFEVFLLADNWLFEKSASGLAEVRARNGHVVVVTNTSKKVDAQAVVRLDTKLKLLTPVLMNVVLQLFAYHVAVARGTDVDQPRNLAKSVTVE
jgi:glucosamine--fructose-6-phosphate aminotransferase (isomerizing)